MYTIDELVMKAYELCKREISTETEELALTTLNALHDSIEKWDGSMENLNIFHSI